jgi:HicB family
MQKETSAFNLKLSKSAHRELKAASAMEGVSMNQMINALIDFYNEAGRWIILDIGEEEFLHENAITERMSNIIHMYVERNKG